MKSESMPHADFLPEQPCSYDKLREAVLNNLEETIALIPPFPVAELDIKTMEQMEPGTYVLNERPSQDFMKEILKFGKGKCEVGLICIKGKWLICLGFEHTVSWPDTIKSIQRDGIFSLDMHTHPTEDPGSEQPSNDDILRLGSTADGYQYIINKDGILKFHLPENLPGGFKDAIDHHKAWTYWIHEELKMTAGEFNKKGGWEVKKEFLQKYFGLTLIPWKNKDEIEKILGKENS